MVTPPGPRRPYDLPPAYQPGPPPIGMPDAGLIAQRRANLDAGADRGKGTTRVVLVAFGVILLLLVVGCAAVAWVSVGQYLPLGDRIRAESGGRAQNVFVVVGFEAYAIVQIVLAEGVTSAEARDLICGIVLPRVREAGIPSPIIQLVSVDLGATTITTSAQDPCPT